MITASSRTRRFVRRVRRVLAEMRYVQRRMFEIRTGLSLGPSVGPLRGSIKELDWLYQYGSQAAGHQRLSHPAPDTAGHPLVSHPAPETARHPR
jgi:hypothetical protein